MFCPHKDAKLFLGISDVAVQSGKNETHLGWEANKRGGRGWEGGREREGWMDRGELGGGRVGHRNKPNSHLMSSLYIILNPHLLPSLLLDTETR